MRIFVIIYISLSVFALWGQSNTKVLTLNEDNGKELNITEYVSLYTDKLGNRTIDDVKSSYIEFLPFDTITSYEYPTTHWLKLDVVSNLDSIHKWIVFTSNYKDYKYLNGKSLIDAYLYQGDSLISYDQSGDFKPRHVKSIKERALFNAIPLHLTAPGKHTLYIRVQDIRQPYSTDISLVLLEPNPYLASISKTDHFAILGASGAYFIIGIYILFFFLATRNTSYIFFSLYAIFMGLHYHFIAPVGGFVDYIIPNHPHLGPWLFSLVMFSYPFIFLFGRYFTDLPNRHPKWDKYLIAITVIVSLWGINHIINNLSPPYSERTGAFFAALILSLPLCVRLVISNHLQSRVFAIGIFWLFLWNSLGMMWNFGIIQLPFIPWIVGQVGFLLIYGIGLGYDLMHTEKEKAEAKHVLELDSIKSNFFANISHEFRTPLSLILGPINQIYDTIPASESIEESTELSVNAKYLKVMKRNALRLQSLVDQLLDLSKLDSGKMNLQLSKGNIIQFIRSIVFSFESLADRKHIQYDTSFAEEIEGTYFDADKLEKILVNLLSNAFKFTPEHGRIKVEVADLESQLKISITDSGKGISQKEIDLIFDRFYQTEDTENQGTGIGLALVKELVHLHNGVISVSSTKGEGTTFKLCIPYKREHFDPAHISQNEKGHEIKNVSDQLDGLTL